MYRSVFFRKLSTQFKAHMAAAVGEATFVCVPQTASLASTTITLADVENHVLKSTGVRGEFQSLSGKRATITGTEVITGAGYKEQLAARILGTERWTLPPEAMPKSSSPTPPDWLPRCATGRRSTSSS